MLVWQFIKKEVKCSKTNLTFHLGAIISPLLFLMAFTLMLIGSVKVPLIVYDTGEGEFLSFLKDYHSPSGEAYFGVEVKTDKNELPLEKLNVLEMVSAPSDEEGKLTGEMTLHFNDCNANMTKNYRNRLHGAILAYFNTLPEVSKIVVEEKCKYPKDIPWSESFGVSILALCLSLAGLLFGSLAMTHEWEGRMMGLIRLSPKSLVVLMGTKGLVALLKVYCAVSIYLGVFYLIFHKFPQHFAQLMIFIGLIAGVFILVGLLYGHYLKSTVTSFLCSMVTALFLWVSGGGFGPMTYFGNFANMLSRYNPLTYAITVFCRVFFTDIGINVEDMGVLLVFFLGALLAVSGLLGRWHRKAVH